MTDEALYKMIEKAIHDAFSAGRASGIEEAAGVATTMYPWDQGRVIAAAIRSLLLVKE